MLFSTKAFSFSTRRRRRRLRSITKATLRVMRRVLYNWVFALSQMQAQDKSEQWLQDMKP